MKKILVLALVVLAIVALIACGENKKTEDTTAANTTVAEEVTTAAEEVTTAAEAKVMTYAEYVAAKDDDAVVIEAYVQAKQSWWNNKVTVYTQDKDGAYFIYELTCSEEDNAKLVPGTKIRVTGFKTSWMGEVEVASGATFEIIDGADTYIAPAFDVTALIGTDDLIKHENEFVSIKGAEVIAYDESGAAFAYKNTENKTDDLYFKVKVGENVCNYCVEFYLCGQDTDVYKAVEALKVGDIVDLEGFLYWYNDANLHTTKVTVVNPQ